MTSKLTVEEMLATDSELQMLIDSHEKGTAMFLRVDAYYLMAKELRERRKAEMDSEPVGEFYEDGPLNWYQISDGDRVPAHRRIPLYRHAQQPVVMDDTKLRELFDSWFASDCSFDLSPEASEADNIAWRESYWYVWQRCRAAMLQAQSDDDGEPTDDERIMAIEGIIPPISSGNSPVIPDGWIPCCERLPPEGYEPGGGAVCYIVWRKNEVNIGPQCSISNVFFLRKHWETHFTHWMPLPAAPQELKP